MLSKLDFANIVIDLEPTLILPFLVSLVPQIWSSMLPAIPFSDSNCYNDMTSASIPIAIPNSLLNRE